jgi:type II secretory pathway pseudopilin PulG
VSRRRRGYALVALMAAVTMMSIAMAAAVPAWKWVVQNDREEELIFRGAQIASAIRRYQAKNGNALPVSLDVLVKGKFLRKAYKDPMTRGEGGKEADFQLIRQGQALPGAGGVRPPGSTGIGPSPSPSPSPAGRVGQPLGGTSVGAFIGVASKSTQKGYRLVNNRERYNEWWFLAGQPIVVGRRLVSGPPAQLPGGRGQPPRPGQPQTRP